MWNVVMCSFKAKGLLTEFVWGKLIGIVDERVGVRVLGEVWEVYCDGSWSWRGEMVAGLQCCARMALL